MRSPGRPARTPTRRTNCERINSAPPAPPVDTASGLGGGGGFRAVEEYLDHLRAYGVERFPSAGHEEGVHLDAATAVLGDALAHFVDTYRTLHADGYRGAIASVKALI
ncbi:hypothetical protein [Curtobacterium sp. VKM Ac-2887]|uniref:hypothetical protein n=1 Tax=Curtobacterium sp. VKM Ac-2887 TaxID=2783819 RepID=UPI00188B1BB1|nr:hypothetical protein [Curtobacterium sp. VKM Ac-2887]MBF4587626.1 hypothetical protein [Curtobacterium sp. VKM Ac-2887]